LAGVANSFTVEPTGLANDGVGATAAPNGLAVASGFANDGVVPTAAAAAAANDPNGLWPAAGLGTEPNVKLGVAAAPLFWPNVADAASADGALLACAPGAKENS
jgi:hypothetical protein